MCMFIYYSMGGQVTCVCPFITIWEGRLRVYVHLLQYGRAGYVCMSIYYNMGGQVTCKCPFITIWEGRLHCPFITIWEGRLCVNVHLLQYGRAGYV